MPGFELTADQQEANFLLGGPQRNTCLVGGSRSGKTTLLVRGVVIRALRGGGSRHAILRHRNNHVWSSIGRDTFPKVMRICFPNVPYKLHRADGFFQLPNGSEIWLGGLDDKQRVEKILGQEYATILLNECSQIPYSSYLVALTRLAQEVPGLVQRMWCDLNPVGSGHWTNRVFGEHREPQSGRPLTNADDYRRMFLNPAGNSANLSAAYLETLRTLPEKQRKRFYDGVYVPEVDGALWTFDGIEQCRVELVEVPELVRIVVGVDPSGASDKDEDNRSDEIGIVVVGLGTDGHAYVLYDRSMVGGPATWGRRVVEAFHEVSADRVVAEVNYGGEMVRYVIQVADDTGAVPVKVVHASRGKSVRAEPVSELYEKGKVHHVGRFERLEDQMCNFSTSGYVGDKSPDRADALVWAITDLMIQPGAQFGFTAVGGA